MLKVIVRFDTKDARKNIRMEGLAADYPLVGAAFEFTYVKQRNRIIVDLGMVFNIESYGDMLLVQTEHVVAEIWIISGEVEEKFAEILPFVSSPDMLFIKKGKVTSLNYRKGASLRPDRLINLVKYLEPSDIAQVYPMASVKEV